MGLANITERFAQLKAVEGSIGARIHAIISGAAQEIDKLADESPVLMSIIQHLEQAAQITVASPHLTGPASADPTSAASAPPEAASPSSTSTEPSSPSAGGSTP